VSWLGSDFPFDMGTDDPLDALRAADLTDHDFHSVRGRERGRPAQTSSEEDPMSNRLLTHLRHVDLAVPDYDKQLDFYSGVWG